MKNIILTVIFSFSIIFAQGITNTIGGNTADDKFIVENKDSKVGLVVTGEGMVGIGTTTPTYPLEVVQNDANSSGSAATISGYFENAITGGNRVGIRAVGNPGDGSLGVGVDAFGNWMGVWGTSVGFENNTTGVYGEARLGVINKGVAGYGSGNGQNSKNAYGGYFQGAYSQINAVGVRGSAEYGTYSYGGQFEGQNASSHAFGVWAIAHDAPHSAGVYGISRNTSAEKWGMGIYGEATGPNNGNYGVYGFAEGATGGNFAGYFLGNVYTTGTLTKAAGSFKIDHPLDPENKYLSHSFVESPDMMNIYNGNVILNNAGEAVIELPDYFNALNSDYRYQLTAVGAPGPNLYISQEFNGNAFSIAGGEPGMKVSWLITGIRQDTYANANRIKVEENKTGNEMGKYLHPKVFGLPKSAGIAKDMLPADHEKMSISDDKGYHKNNSLLYKQN